MTWDICKRAKIYCQIFPKEACLTSLQQHSFAEHLEYYIRVLLSNAISFYTLLCLAGLHSGRFSGELTWASGAFFFENI